MLECFSSLCEALGQEARSCTVTASIPSEAEGGILNHFPSGFICVRTHVKTLHV